MKYGILKDIKEGEFRVISTPAEVKSIIASGHEVWQSMTAVRQQASLMKSISKQVLRLQLQRKKSGLTAIWLPKLRNLLLLNILL